MSTDFEDPQLDELLSRHARDWQAGFTPPSLDGMIEVATSRPSRPRWLLPVAAAAVLLALPVATVVIAHHGRSTPATRAPAPRLPLDQVRWKDPILQADGRTVTIHIALNIACGDKIPTVQAAVSSTTPTGVSIQATSYVTADAPTAPAAPGQSCFNSPATPLDKTLPVRIEDLHGRALIDTSSGMTHALLDSRTVPTPSYLPPGYTGGDVRHNDESSDPIELERVYRKGELTITILRETWATPTLLEPYSGHTVLGHPALQLGLPMVIGWRDGRFLGELIQRGLAESDMLDEATMLRIAGSLHY